MTSHSLSDLRVLVLAEGDTPSAVNNARGHLFEVFVARLLHTYGYEAPKRQNLNVTSDGIELDVVASSRLSTDKVAAECKAYSRPVKASELTSFYGKLHVERFDKPNLLGIMVVVPRLTPEGEEKARTIAEQDKKFIYLPAHEIGRRLAEEKVITEPSVEMGVTSDPAIVITKDGVYSARIVLDALERVPRQVSIWSATGAVPTPTLELVASSDYSQGLPVVDINVAQMSFNPVDSSSVYAPVLVTVKGSRGDFEYQLPASPRFFVGRKAPVQQLQALLTDGPAAVVLNAQSGWGKSSLALKFADLAKVMGGHALVFDSRTAGDPRFVIEAVRRAASEAANEGLLRLPETASWASLASVLSQ